MRGELGVELRKVPPYRVMSDATLPRPPKARTVGQHHRNIPLHRSFPDSVRYGCAGQDALFAVTRTRRVTRHAGESLGRPQLQSCLALAQRFAGRAKGVGRCKARRGELSAAVVANARGARRRIRVKGAPATPDHTRKLNFWYCTPPHGALESNLSRRSSLTTPRPTSSRLEKSIGTTGGSVMPSYTMTPAVLTVRQRSIGRH